MAATKVRENRAQSLPSTQRRTKRSIGQGRDLTTVANQPQSVASFCDGSKRVLVSDDGLYDIGLISQWEHSDMFRNAREQCIYEVLVRHISRMGIRISAGSSIDALNVLKEAAIFLAGSNILDAWFRKWIESCTHEFERRFKAILVTNSAKSY